MAVSVFLASNRIFFVVCAMETVLVNIVVMFQSKVQCEVQFHSEALYGESLS